jgi:hypothetical protein
MGHEIESLLDSFYAQRLRGVYDEVRLLVTQTMTDGSWTILSGSQEEHFEGGPERSPRRTLKVLSKRRAEMAAFTKFLNERASNRPNEEPDAENVSAPNEM